MLARFLQNHVLATLAYLVVVVMGTLIYLSLPREQDPAINFNWIEITTAYPGASAEDVEKQVTDVLEDAVRNLSDVRFVSSNSREGVSQVLVRFQDIDDATFEKRVNDLRREVQNQQGELPGAAEAPVIVELNSANAFPAATLVVTGLADDENLRWQARQVKQDLERIPGVERVIDLGLHKPELQVNFLPGQLEGLGLSPTDLADTITSYYRNVSAGTVQVDRQDWLVRLAGIDTDPNYLAALPVVTGQGEVALGTLAVVERGREKPQTLARFNGQPAVMLAASKRAGTNLLTLVERIAGYVESRNQLSGRTGVRLVLIDDQTEITRNLLQLMQNNAVVGLVLVLLVCWIFLGGRMAMLTALGIPFSLAGTFWLLSILGHTVNAAVLLGVVISLGMLVDDAVVVVEAIYYRLQQGRDALIATVGALREVFAPVTSSVLTTVAAFLPLMLLPGILGKFMRVIPEVVVAALLISLIEAFWMLPAHVVAARVGFAKPSRVHVLRVKLLHAIRTRYTRVLLRVLRYPRTALAGVCLVIVSTLGAAANGAVDFDFFASDPLRIFYVNVEMPSGTPLEDTMAKVLEVERKVRAHTDAKEVRAIASYAGQAFSETMSRFGSQYGQILVSLRPRGAGLRDVDTVIEEMRADVLGTTGPRKISFLRLSGGPPIAKPINLKVRGDNIDELRAAVHDIKAIMLANPAIIDVTDDENPGLLELNLRVNQDAARRARLDPARIARTISLLVDGEIVASLQDRGETVGVRVRARSAELGSLDELLRYTVDLPGGGRMPLAELVEPQTGRSQGNIRHYDFRRTITVEADIRKEQTNTVAANDYILAGWGRVRDRYAGVSLDFSGELDDIAESLQSIKLLFLFGVGLIYLILGTQFRSYFQPLLILSAVPMAFTGVVLGLLITGNPLSLYTLYGVVALTGVAVNSAIVLISAANERLAAGMSVAHAILYASRRRVVPILVTSVTTIAGLFSLATGLAGHSLIWGPVATAIVWGLGFSTVLTLLLIPLLYRLAMGRNKGRLHAAAGRPEVAVPAETEG